MIKRLIVIAFFSFLSFVSFANNNDTNQTSNSPTILIIAGNPEVRITEINSLFTYLKANITSPLLLSKITTLEAEYNSNFYYKYPETYSTVDILKYAISQGYTSDEIAFLYGSGSTKILASYLDSVGLSGTIDVQEASSQNIVKYLQSPKLRAVFYIGDGMPYGLTIENGAQFTYTNIPKINMQNIKFISCSCLAFNKPFITPLENNDISFFMSGVTTLDIFGSPYIAKEVFKQYVLDLPTENIAEILSNISNEQNYKDIISFETNLFGLTPTLGSDGANYYRWGFYGNNIPESYFINNQGLTLNATASVNESGNAIVSFSWNGSSFSGFNFMSGWISEYAWPLALHESFPDLILSNQNIANFSASFPFNQTNSMLYCLTLITDETGITSSYVLVTQNSDGTFTITNYPYFPYNTQ